MSATLNDLRRDTIAAPDLAAKVPQRIRIAQLLKHGALTVEDIATALDIPDNSVSQVVKRGLDTLFVKLPGPNGTRIGLKGR